MTSLISTINQRIVGTVEEVFTDHISVLLDTDSPHSTALNAGFPTGFPRINGIVVIPNESGGTVCFVSSIRIIRLPFPKRLGTQKDFSLVDLPFPSRHMHLVPIGTVAVHHGDTTTYKVHRGVDVLPSVGDSVFLPTLEQLQAIVQGEEDATKRILIGHCPTSGYTPVYVDPDRLFGRHLAVLGNTGAGKSCTVAGLVRWSLEAANSVDPSHPPNARFIILDPNGEYASAFDKRDVRVFQVGQSGQGSALRVPAWLWTGAEWAAFTSAAPGVQRPLLLEALRRLRSGFGPPGEFDTVAKGRISRYRNRIKVLIANGDHQASGKREGVAAVLTNIHDDFLDLADRDDCTNEELRRALQCIPDIASNLEIKARGNQKNPPQDGYWHNDFSESDLDQLIDALGRAARHTDLTEDVGVADVDAPIPFRVSELPNYVEALATDQISRDANQFVDTLKLRIDALLKTESLASVIDDSNNPDPMTLEAWLNEYIGEDRAKNGPVVVLDLSLVPSEAIHTIVSVLARMIFEALQRYRREYRCELPTTLVLEEAHTFIHRELRGDSTSAAGQECARVFNRIAREGRKFGLGLVLASQRPSEISPTVLSQCNTFLLHRIVNDLDQDLVKRLIPDGLGVLLRELPSLPTRRAILLGWAAPAPTLIEVQEIPDQFRPHSPDPSFWDVWTGKKSRSINWKKIESVWQQR